MLSTRGVQRAAEDARGAAAAQPVHLRDHRSAEDPHDGAVARAALRPAPTRRTRSCSRCCARSAPPTASRRPSRCCARSRARPTAAGATHSLCSTGSRARLGHEARAPRGDGDPRPDRSQALARRARRRCWRASRRRRWLRCGARSSRASTRCASRRTCWRELRDLVVARLVDDPGGADRRRPRRARRDCARAPRRTTPRPCSRLFRVLAHAHAGAEFAHGAPGARARDGDRAARDPARLRVTGVARAEARRAGRRRLRPGARRARRRRRPRAGSRPLPALRRRSSAPRAPRRSAPPGPARADARPRRRRAPAACAGARRGRAATRPAPPRRSVLPRRARSRRARRRRARVALRAPDEPAPAAARPRALARAARRARGARRAPRPRRTRACSR